ncbi:hypothetical protein V5F89_09090 [Pelagerythrobacter marensis]|uniref:SH3 domain-containing protein n=1 Tax=Pelagerythrobacter marensis TaxID=543877 RepID=A0ABZ2D269_9SPHN
MRAAPIVPALLLALALAACGEGRAPSEELRDATERLVQEAAGAATPPPAGGPYAPRDECAGLPGGDAFRRDLARAVEARDVDAMLALAAPDIKLDFGGGAGAEQLRKRLEQPESPLWQELAALLRLGCAAQGQAGMTIPWYFAQSIDGVDPMTGMIVTGKGVPLRMAAAPDAEPVRALSWNVVEPVGGYVPDAPFQHVATVDGARGYVATNRLRSLIDYRLIASSRDGKWSITSLVAGD